MHSCNLPIILYLQYVYICEGMLLTTTSTIGIVHIWVCWHGVDESIVYKNSVVYVWNVG